MLIDNLTERESFKIARKRKKLTLMQVAKILELSESTVCKFENNKRNLTEEQLKKYIELLNK